MEEGMMDRLLRWGAVGALLLSFLHAADALAQPPSAALCASPRTAGFNKG